MSRATKTANDLYTVEDFYAIIPDGQKADLIDGVIYVASPDSIRSNDLTAFLLYVMRGFNSAKRLGGRVFVTRVAYRLSKHSAPEPDVGYVSKERVHLVRDTDVRGGPDIAVEIVSRDSIDRDYRLKKRRYQKAGVREYWIIDPLQNKVTFYRLRGGRYRRVPLEGRNIFRSEVLPGFWLDKRWLLQRPAPSEYDCLRQILRG
jgi:Uma2 family endonuclease